MKFPKRDDLFSLEPSSQLFYVSVVFFVLGLSTQFPIDFQAAVPFLIINDLVSYLVFATTLFLVLAKVSRPGIGLLINLFETLRNFYFSMVWSSFYQPDSPSSGDWMQEVLLLTCLFAAVIGLSVNKVLALLFAAFVVLAQFLYLQAFQWDEFVRMQFMVTSLVMTGSLLVIYYYRSTLEKLVNDLKNAFNQTHELKNRAEALEIKNRPFVSFGKNTAGLVHDFRNDINAMSIAIQTLSLQNGRGKELDQNVLDRINRAMDSLNHRIAMVRYVTELGQDGMQEDLDLRVVLEAAAYAFRISPEIRGKINFDFNYIGQVEIMAKRLLYLQLFENIIRNSCEAIIDLDRPQSNGNLGTVAIVIARYGDLLKMEFRDTAGGIRACIECRSHICLECRSFALGKTSKKYGSGIGMVNIFQAIRSLSGRLNIESSPKGTIITVSVPLPPE